MVTTVQHSSTATIPPLAKHQSGNDSKLAAQQTSLRLQLSNALQTTLELGKILQLFFDAVQENLALDSLQYHNDKLITPIEIGNSNRHQCVYTLLTQQDKLGVLTFSRSKRFREQELELLEILINCLIYPVRNALLYRDAVQSALRDSLTGAGNRLALENTLEREIALAFRNQLPLSILVVDIDHFKRVNDRYGHAAGDSVLKNVVSMFGQGCRETDAAYRAYRFGGEEFVLILNNTERKGARIVAERIRHCVEQTSTPYLQHNIEVTVSVGFATLLEGDSMSTLFARADKALYQAKHNGRNQVMELTASAANLHPTE